MLLSSACLCHFSSRYSREGCAVIRFWVFGVGQAIAAA